jgi:hypothetical protein
MAGIFIGGADGIARNSPKAYIGGTDGIARKIKKIYIGRLFPLCFHNNIIV